MFQWRIWNIAVDREIVAMQDRMLDKKAQNEAPSEVVDGRIPIDGVKVPVAQQLIDKLVSFSIKDKSGWRALRALLPGLSFAQVERAVP
jgi:hypothetical protein